MIRVVPQCDDVDAHWRLIGRTSSGADVLATGPIPADTGGRPGPASSWQDAVGRLRDGVGALRIDHTDDGHYRWTLLGPDEEITAQSPGAYRDAPSCRQAFTVAQRAARTALGGAAHAHRRAAEPPREDTDEPPNA